MRIDHPERKHEERRKRAAAAASKLERKLASHERAKGAKPTNGEGSVGDPIDSHSLTHPSLNPFGGRQETEFRTVLPQIRDFLPLTEA